MDSAEKTALIEQILTRAAEEIGDITEPVLATYYQRFPDARKLFEMHACGNIKNLEGRMVENSLFCLMYWHESPGEIEILFWDSVPHHNDTLKIPPDMYQEFLTATADVIEKTIPSENSSEIEVWEELCSELADLITKSSELIYKPLAAAGGCPA